MPNRPQMYARKGESGSPDPVYPSTIALHRESSLRSASHERSQHSTPRHEGEGSLWSPKGLKLRRALVTGANGFIGGHLIESLQKRNVAVRGAVRGAADREFLESLDIECLRVDWRDDAALAKAAEGVDAVFHLAAAVSAVEIETLYEINVGLTERMARACASVPNPPVFVYCSTIAAAGPSPRGELRTEADPPSPISAYGRSKRGGEIVLERMASRLPATIVRPGIVVGPRNRELLPIYQTIHQLRVHFVPNFHPPRLTMLHVDDACEILIRAAERGARLPEEPQPASVGRGIYYAASWEHPNYDQLGRMVGEGLGIGSPLILHLHEPMNWLVGFAGEMIARFQGTNPAVSRDKICEAIASSWATSPAKTERELGHRTSDAIADHLAELGTWYRESGWLA